MGSRKELYSDEEIIARIQAGGSEMETMLAYVYKRYWPMVKDFVFRQNGSAIEAEEVFQEGMIAFYENILQGKFQHKSSVSSYLFAICRYTWQGKFHKKIRKEKVEVPLDGVEKGGEGFLGRLMEKDEYERALQWLDQLGESCKKLLVYVHYFNYSMKEVAVKMGYKSDQIARNKHYRCNKSLERILEKSNA